jgi:uncharacterized membrane protein
MDRALVASFVALALAAGSLATGCAGMSRTEQRALSGGAIGAATGALIGGIYGHPGTGAAIGGATGAAGGYLYEKNEERNYGR